MSVPRLRAPIVLIHGLFGFDRLQMGSWVLTSYFRGVPETLGTAGNRVLVARVSPAGGVVERAGQLKELLDREAPNEPVHLFGHSMGGLDARYLISRLGMAERVLSLTTLGTPHRGTTVADWGMRRFKTVVGPVLDFFGLPYRAFEDLTVARSVEFNEQVPDAPNVRYFSVAGEYHRDWRSPQWGLSGAILDQAEGPNDGIVSVASARYGENCEVWDGDHMNLINWHNPLVSLNGRGRDRVPDYVSLVQRLADEGF
jgi:triacylglycerol lipase